MKLIVSLLLFIICLTHLSSGQEEYVEIPLSEDTSTLDSLLNVIRDSIDVSDLDISTLKQSLDRNIAVSSQEYIAYYLRLLDVHLSDLSMEELADVHFCVAEELYLILGSEQAWQYLNLYPKINTELLDTHRSFLSAIIYSNDMKLSSKSQSILLNIKPIYEQYNHANQIRLLSGIALFKGENEFLDEAFEYYNRGIEKSKAFPGHKFVCLLRINYLYFLSYNDSFRNKHIAPEAFREQLDYLINGEDYLWQFLGLSIKLSSSDFLEPTLDQINSDVAKAEQIRTQMSASARSHATRNATAEFYMSAAEAYEWVDGQRDLVSEYLDKSIEMYEDGIVGNWQLIYLYRLKINSLKKSGQFDQVYEAYVAFDSLNSLYHTADKNEAIAQMNARFLVKEEQLKSNLLSLQNQRLVLLMVPLGLAFIASIAFVISLRHNNRIKEQLNQKLSALNKKLIAAHDKISNQNSQLTRKTEELKDELKAKLLMISKGNEAISIVKNQIDAVELAYKDRNKIKSALEKISNPEILDTVEQQHLKMNEDFAKVLTELHPTLTLANVKLCILVKIGLSTKEIAQLGFKTCDSVKVAKNRLKRKLKLDAQTTLFAYFNFLKTKAENRQAS